MGIADWQSVDAYIEDALLGDDSAAGEALRRNSESGLPEIDVSPAQAVFLGVLARAIGARRVLEVGTLGGYSTIQLARGIADDGLVTTIELNPEYSAVARANLEAAAVSDRVEVIEGAAIEVLDQMLVDPPEPFDFTFIDADKERSPEYFERAAKLSRPGAVIVVDNVVREGSLAAPASGDTKSAANRRLHESIGQEPEILATTIQTVGRKGWDGFTIAVIE